MFYTFFIFYFLSCFKLNKYGYIYNSFEIVCLYLKLYKNILTKAKSKNDKLFQHVIRKNSYYFDAERFIELLSTLNSY